MWNDPAWKARLKAENEAAIAAGVFGAPFFVVDGEPFWGNDRRPQIERWLEKGRSDAHACPQVVCQKFAKTSMMPR